MWPVLCSFVRVLVRCVLLTSLAFLIGSRLVSAGDPLPEPPTVVDQEFVTVESEPSLFGQPVPAYPVYGPLQEEIDANGETVIRLTPEMEKAADVPDIPAAWPGEIADSNDCVSGKINLALDPNGRPHVTYYNTCLNEIKYSWRDGTGWHITGFTFDPDSIGQTSDIVVGPDGIARIIVQNSTLGDLWYAYRSSGAWKYELIDSNNDTGYYCSMTLDALGRVHVAYYDWAHGGLMYKFRDSAGWHTAGEAVIIDGGYGTYTSIVTDPTDVNHYPHIFYSGSETIPSYLYHSWQIGPGSWSTETINRDGEFASTNSAAIDQWGQPHVTYFDNSSGDMKYSHLDDAGWHTTRFWDENDQYGNTNSIAIDKNGNPHITLWNSTQNELWMVTNDGSGWIQERIYDGTAHAIPEMGWNDLKLDLNDQPTVAYITEVGSTDVRVGWAIMPLPKALKGYTTTGMNVRDANRCANNVVAQFNSLRDHGEVMGFHLNAHPDITYDFPPLEENDVISHWQGMQRLMPGNGRFLAITQSYIRRMTTCGGSACLKESSGFAIVHLGTRNLLYDRFRSNRLDPDTSLADTAPNGDDGVVRTVYMSSTEPHPGGIQALGQILAVSTEKGDDAHIWFYDLTSNPSNLTADQPVMPGAEYLLVSGSSGTAVALTKLSSGRYLLAVSNTDPTGVTFYISYAPDSLSGSGKYLRFIPLDWFPKSELAETPGNDFKHHEWDSYQGMSFITECGSGDIYMAAMGNRDSTAFSIPWFPSPPTGDDYADLFKVGMNGTSVTLTRVGQRHFWCGLNDTTHCNFDAATGAYVNAGGQLILYSSEHDNKGPSLSDNVPGSVKFMEFRPVPHTTNCATNETAWVELYDNRFKEDNLGKGLMIDWVDRNLENYLNYDDAESFEDKAESVRWCLPSGLSYRIYEDKVDQAPYCDGKHLTLYGNNKMYEIGDLDVKAMRGKASCSYFTDDAPISAGFNAAGGQLIYTYYLFPETRPFFPGEGKKPDAETTLKTILDMPAGALGAATIVKYSPTTPSSFPPGQVWAGAHGFNLSLSPSGNYLKSATITIHYAAVETRELYPETMYLGYHDPVNGWIEASETCGPPVPPTHNRIERWFRTILCMPGEYALFGDRMYMMYLPITRKK